MVSPFKNEILLEHILEAIGEINKFTHNVTAEKFYDNTLTQSGVIRQLEIIGEATKSLPKEFTQEYVNIPWSDLAKLRDKLIHNYFGIELKIVWDLVKNDLPLLEQELNELLQQIRKS